MSENKMKFIIPGLYEHYELNLRLIQMIKEHPEYFHPGVEIGAAYGNFQFCIFDGGRIFGKYRHTTREEIEAVVQAYNNLGVPVRLIFTNPVIPEEAFHNRFGHVILDICHNGKNEIVVNNPKFEAFLKERYPNFGYISSTTKCLTAPDALRAELDKDYKMVCWDYNLNKNQKLLESIPADKKDKCEFLCNAICPPGCPNRKEHYRLNGLFSLSYGKPYATQDCPIEYDTLHESQCTSRNNLSPEEILTKYAPMGYSNFKLEGRTLGVVENLCNYVRYMVKPEHQFYVLNMILQEDPTAKLYNNNRVFITPIELPPMNQ